MIIFNLPDLGEGLPDAEIHEWFVKEGDKVSIDQPLVSVETAKAVVDVPCPQAGIIEKLFAKVGELVKTGAPLVGFQENEKAEKSDKGTVVGSLEESQDLSEDRFSIGSSGQTSRPKASAKVRMLAQKLKVDLSSINGSGEHGFITQEDVEAAAKKSTSLAHGFEPLRGVRRAMCTSMQHSHQEVVPVSLFDEADIHNWSKDSDISVRLIQAIIFATKKEPTLNAWFDGKNQARKCFEEVHLGLAIDSEHGLFVPVIHNAETHSKQELRRLINEYKKAVESRSIPTEKLTGATITLSNFGKFAGRFASPIIVPPMVAILAVGRLYEAAVVHQGHIQAHRMLPLSLSFDHRAVTGGEATRFLAALIHSLEEAS